jgi:hypothetical protein
MFNVKKIVQLSFVGMIVASFAVSAAAHPGHIEQGKKKQKPGSKHSLREENETMLVFRTANFL